MSKQFSVGLGAAVAGFGLGLVLLLFMSPVRLRAQQMMAVGPEFQVNTYVTGAQYSPKVASDGAGNFVVVWTSYYQVYYELAIFGQRFDSRGLRRGGEFRVDGPSMPYAAGYSNGLQSVASDSSGNFVVVWEGYQPPYSCYQCIFGMRFNSVGDRVGIEFQVNSADQYPEDHLGNYCLNPEVAIDGSGNFIVVWEGKDADPEGVVARRFDSGANPYSDHFVVNTYTTGYQGDHGWVAVAADGPGNFVVVWSDGYQDDFGDNLFGQRYDSAGVPQGGEFQVNTYTTGRQIDPAVAMDAAGNFVVAWTSCCDQDGDEYGIFGQRYDSTGNPLGGEFQVNSYTTGYQGTESGYYPALSVAAEPGGGFVVVWAGEGEGDGEWGVFGRHFDSTGSPVGAEFQINRYTTSYQRAPNVASIGGGDFAVVWNSDYQDGEDLSVFGRLLSVPEEQELVLPGKRLIIKNRVPEDKERNKAVWVVKDPGIVVGTRVSPDDPRCVDDPEGTVKASIRFFSNDSGHDTHTISLPCENWTALGPDTYPNALKLGYRYRDQELDEGPCKSITLRGTRLMKASCHGKGETTDLLYDLVQGTSEGTVNAVMKIGLITYCTAFDAFKGKDGSDGKKFKGRNSAAPLSCPEPPPPVCGDGIVDWGETCEDGNAVDGDCCSSTCQLDPLGTACDDGDSCTAVDECDGAGTCVGGSSLCGDGNLDAECGEECDGSDDAACPGFCRPPGYFHECECASIIGEIIDSTGDGAGNALYSGFGVAVDGSGNVYLTGSNSDNAFKIGPGGVITEIIDSSGDGAGNGLDLPRGVAVDGSGNAYLTGEFSHNALKITPGGVISEIIDETGDGAGHAFGYPRSIAVDGSENVYATAEDTDNAFKITPGGVITEIIAATGDGAGNTLDSPEGVAVDGSGNVYVTGWLSNNAFKITPGGVVTEIIDASGDGAGNTLNSAAGIAVDGSGNVYVTGFSSDNAFKITPGGVITEIIDSTGDGAGNTLHHASNIAVDGSENVYVTGSDSHNAFRITPGGVITEIIDSTGDGLENGLDHPWGITVDGSGKVYVAGYWSHNAFAVLPPGSPSAAFLDVTCGLFD